MPGPARRKAQRYGCPGACRHQRPGRCPRQCSRRVLSRRPCWKGGTGLAGNSRGNPVMSHGQQAGQAPDQANEGGQAGARGAGDKSLERHVQRTVGTLRVTRHHQAPNLAGPAGRHHRNQPSHTHRHANGTAPGHHLLGRAPRGLPRVLRDGKGLATGSIEVSPRRPGGSGVGLRLAGRGDDPVCIPHLRGRAGGAGAAPLR